MTMQYVYIIKGEGIDLQDFILHSLIMDKSLSWNIQSGVLLG
jgi:hypothetical protein